MDVNVIKTKDQVVAFSIFPIGAVGFGKDEKQAINDLNDNIYDFCNWLLWKLPKEPESVVKARYVGEVKEVSFKEDDKKFFKKYGEVVMQTAFSFKGMIGSANLLPDEKEKVEKVFEELGFKDGEGILERSATILESDDFCLAREFIYKVYRLAKELFFSIKNQNREIDDTFKFAI